MPVTHDGLSPAALRLIARHISSVEKLEVLLLLRRTRTTWSGSAVATELRIDAGSAGNRLRELEAEGFVRPSDEGHIYDARGEVDRDVEQLAREYAERRVAVITAIFSAPRDELRAFADAFRVRGKP
jgi:hypothetical protein